MGYKNTKYVVTDVGQNQECCLGNLTLCEDPRSTLSGKVVDCHGHAVAGALVSAYRVHVCHPPVDPCDMELDHPIGRAFTDQHGRFIIIVCAEKDDTFLLDIFAPSVFGSCSSEVKRCKLSDQECCHPKCAHS